MPELLSLLCKMFASFDVIQVTLYTYLYACKYFCNVLLLNRLISLTLKNKYFHLSYIILNKNIKV